MGESKGAAVRAEYDMAPRSGIRKYVSMMNLPISFRDAWPWLSLIFISGFCIVAQALGLFKEGVGAYLYVITCSIALLLGLFGFMAWMAEAMGRSKEALKYASLVAAAENLFEQMEDKRPDYRNHWRIVRRISRATGERMDLGEREIEDLDRAAEIMDIGMLDLLEEIGSEPADESVERIIRSHPVRSVEILADINPEWSILPLVRHHHEHYDGTGYPDHLRGEDIPIGARILTVADSFAAMSSDRPYKPNRSFEEIIAELRRCSGTRYDPRVVEAVVELINTDKENLARIFRE